jgi:hypothetical protein
MLIRRILVTSANTNGVLRIFIFSRDTEKNGRWKMEHDSQKMSISLLREM